MMSALQSETAPLAHCEKSGRAVRNELSIAAKDEPTLDDKVAFLGRPGAYSGAVGDVICRETHMSWVFLAGSRVYKLKKPVRFSYLDFSTLGRREAACRAELL